MLRVNNLIGFGARSGAALWTPLNVLAGGPTVWHDILNPLNTYSGAAVVTLANKGSAGSGYDVTQGTAGSRPQLVGTAGVPGVYAVYDGGDTLDTSGAVSTPGTLATYTHGMLIRYASASGGSITEWFPGGGGINYCYDNGTFNMDIGDFGSSRISAGVSYAGAVQKTIVTYRNGAAMGVHSNGNPTADGTNSSGSGSASSTTTFKLLPSAPNTSRFYELCIFSSALSAADMQRLAAYMAWRHGQQAILHASNPYTAAAPTV